MPTIYIAGKIRIGRETFRPFNIGVESAEYINHAPIQLDDFFSYSGPFAIGCDHGCYHGDETHGAGKNGGGCNSDGISEGIIHGNCLHQIRKSDIFLAWIDSKDCFGTISELGYAYGLTFTEHKPRVFVAFDHMMGDASAIKDFWFVSRFGENLGSLNSLAQALDIIQNMIEAGMPRKEPEDNDVPFTRFS